MRLAFLVDLKVDKLRRNRWIKILSKIFTLEGIYIVAAVLLSAGLINYLLEGTSVPASTVVTNSLETQSILETIAYFFTTSLAMGGLYLLLRSSQPSKSGRESLMVFFGGFIILLIGFFLIFSFYSFKRFG